MPSAANGNSKIPASSEATDNSPVRQIMTIIEHKIRNLEKRKSKLTSYRDLQKAGKELKADQKLAVSKFEEVSQTLEFARDLSKQIASIVTSAEKDAKKQAKKEAWVRYAADTNKIREVLVILDCLMQMGNSDARGDFLNGTNGAAKLSQEDLKILDDLYPEVTPKHELSEEGLPAFPIQSTKAAEHLYAIVDGKPKEVLGTTYSRIKEIVTTVQECGYFDRVVDAIAVEVEETLVITQEEEPQEPVEQVEVEPVNVYPPANALPVPPAPSVIPAPAYPLRPLPPMTLQEVEHAYFSQYPQQRPITEVIGSQNFFFLQESEIDSPVGTPQPPQMGNQPSPAGPIPTQTFTNQHFVQLPGGRVADPTGLPMPPQPHFSPHPEHPGFPPAPVQMIPMPVQQIPAPGLPQNAVNIPSPINVPTPVSPPQQEERSPLPPVEDKNDDDWNENRSPENEDGERKTQGQGDGQNRFRRYGRGGSRGAPNGHRGRGGFASRQGDGYRPRHGEYQSRGNKDGYQGRQYDGYQSRHKDGYQGRDDGYYGNGDAGEHREHREPREHREHREHENGGRERYGDAQGYQGGFKGRGRGAGRARGGPGGAGGRPPRAAHYARKPDAE